MDKNITAENVCLPTDQGPIKNRRKKVKIIFIILGIVLIIGITMMWDANRKIKSGDLIKRDGQWYTKEQIKTKDGQQNYNNSSD